MTMLFDPAKLPQPDDMGFFYHPDLPDTEEDEPITGPLAAIHHEAAFVAFEHDVDESLCEAWFHEGDTTAPLRWTPTKPAGDCWLLAAKYDTEDGPYALFVRPLPIGG